MRSWIEISSKTLQNNLNKLQVILPNESNFCPILKSNAYGHGLSEMHKVLSQMDHKIYGVDSIEEAYTINNNHDQIFILGFIPKEKIIDIPENFIITINSLDQIEYYDKYLTGKSISLKLETGTYRQGLEPEMIEKAINQLNHLQAKIISLHSHLSNAENLGEVNRSQEQYKILNKVYQDNNLNLDYLHIGCSAGLVHNLNTTNLIRLGIMLYGLYPSKDICTYLNNRHINIEPIISFKTKLIQVKKVKKGSYIGYGDHYKAKKDLIIGIIPVGYYDGCSRSMSGKMEAIINNQKVKQIGVICMNMTILDLSNIDAKFDDEVILLGSSDNHSITPDNWANWQNTINYEITTNLKNHIPRIVT